MRIPFNAVSLTGREFEYMRQAIGQRHVSGDGPFTKQCHALLERELGIARALLTTSCTHALEMAALLLELQPGDEVIVPSFTFVSTVNAFVIHGAKPVFADIRPDTLNLDERTLDRLIAPRTRAIVPVHYAGMGCAMGEICAAATANGLTVVEDNAHGLFAKYRGRYLGTFGDLATQSFHETKNFSCGEGGALLINNPRYIERAEILREKGTNRSRFFRGQVDKYSWVDVGSSYLPSDLLAAFLLAQLENRQRIQSARKRCWEFYDQELRGWATNHGVGVPFVPDDCEQAYHMYYLLMPSLEGRQGLIRYLAERGICAPFHYVPLHTSDMGRRFGGRQGDCPVTEDISNRLVRLPLYTELSESEQAAVVECVQSYLDLPRSSGAHVF